MSANTFFDNSGLKYTKETARKLGIKIPKLKTWRDGKNDYFEVYSNGNTVWSGTANSAAEAKTNYIETLIEKEI